MIKLQKIIRKQKLRAFEKQLLSIITERDTTISEFIEMLEKHQFLFTSNHLDLQFFDEQMFCYKNAQNSLCKYYDEEAEEKSKIYVCDVATIMMYTKIHRMLNKERNL
ncbi:hypothetical protein AB1I63_09745 [Streptococcus pneumoniae]